MNWLVETGYFAAAVVFILGLKRMSHPSTARSGIHWAGIAMVVATLLTFLHPQIDGRYGLMLLAIVIGGGIAWYSGNKVEMTDMPQMIAIYNGMGGGAAAAIAAVELMRMSDNPALIEQHGSLALWLGVLGAMIGAVAFSGSIVAWAKLDGRLKKAFNFPSQQLINMIVLGLTVYLGIVIAAVRDRHDPRLSHQPQPLVVLVVAMLAAALAKVQDRLCSVPEKRGGAVDVSPPEVARLRVREAALDPVDPAGEAEPGALGRLDDGGGQEEAGAARPRPVPDVDEHVAARPQQRVARRQPVLAEDAVGLAVQAPVPLVRLVGAVRRAGHHQVDALVGQAAHDSNAVSPYDAVLRHGRTYL